MRADIKSWTGRTLSGGRYNVAAKLGEGGMGLVYRARDNHLETDVVIKIPRPDLQGLEDFGERFLREVRSLVRLAHPHVVRVLDVGEEDGVCFAVMQFLAGGSLHDRPARSVEGGALPMRPDSLNGWLEHVAAALDFIHREDYVHRDVKPVNILFDGHGNVFLSDFGMAKALAAILPDNHGANLTGAGTMIGTPGYVSPEQIMGQRIDARADQYGLASTVYELLVGRNPFSGVPASAILVQQATKGARPAIELCPSIPPAASQAIERAMSINPNDRFATCSDFARVVLQLPEVQFTNSTTQIWAGDHATARPAAPPSPLPLRTVPISPADIPIAQSPAPRPVRTPTLVIPSVANASPGLGPAISPLIDRPSDARPPDANSDFLQVACPRCRRPLRLPQSAIGKKVQCPKCGASAEMSPHSPRATPPPKKPGPGGSGAALPPPLPPRTVEPGGQQAPATGPEPVTGSISQFGQWYLTALGVIVVTVGLAIAYLLLGTNVLQTVTGARASHSQATDSKQSDQ
ncbi:MAG TPA: protein kinase [Planctomycetaceae bacterium]|nr:protein kinase [Planctomycetaceae bacterium]